ncbi:MAG TPA: regulatory signaling modulator protein AmpE [Steroidobacteraceae bacterium]|nr:regulatory signaling modulator protein AmpE [Steroidobacteraceae bacterium]
MNFIALLIALLAERLVALRPAVREPDALLAYVRGALRLAARHAPARVGIAIGAALLPGLVVAVASDVLGALVHGIAYVALAALVLFFALGPRDLRREVSEYRAAAARGDAAAAARVAAEILDADASQRRGPGLGSVGEAVFVQANNRLFGVLFWFALLGPFGALAFRISDLMRREALVRADRADAPTAAQDLGDLCRRLHGVIAFVPARLLALTFGVAGSFEESFSGWRSYLASGSDHFADANDRLLVHAGRGALGAAWDEARDEPERARAALALADAALNVWLVVFALLTLVAWLA